MRKPYAIRLYAANVIDGSTFERVYYRGEMRLNKQAFTEYAIGNLLMLISEQNYSNLHEFVIHSVTTLSTEETFTYWKIEAEAQITEHERMLEAFVRNAFPMPE